MKDLELIGLCVALAAGEAGGLLLSDYAALWPVVAVLAVLTAFFGFGWAWRGWRYAFAAVAGLALALCSGASVRATRQAVLERHGNRPVETVLTVGEGVAVHRGKTGREWVAFPSEVDGRPVRVMMAVRGNMDLPVTGERWRCAGRLEWRHGREWWRRGTFWVANRGGTEVIAERVGETDGFRAALSRVRADCSRRVGIGLDHNPRAVRLNRAILLGERREVDAEAHDLFVAAGTMHVFAISGLHVMVVAQVLTYLLLFTFLPVRYRGFLLIPCLWGYVVLTGCGASAVRAATMASFYFSAALFWRRPDGLVAWALTFLLVHALSPELVFDVGASLSFAVMLAIILWSRYSRDFQHRWIAAFGMTLMAWAAGVPIAAHVFGRVTPGGILANLALLPAAAVSVGSGVLGVLASFLSDSLAAHINNLSALFTDAMYGLSHIVAHLPGANFDVRPWTWWEGFSWYAVIVLSLYLVHSIRRRHLC